MKIDIKSILKPSLKLFVICFVVTALLAITYVMTKNKIAERAELGITNSRKEVLAAAETFEDINDNTVCGKDGNGKKVGYVITVTKKGYGGDIEVMVGFGEDGKVSGVSILRQSETPGMGAKTDTEEYLSQYKGLTDNSNEVGDEIDGITGATISSKAVTDAVNEAITDYLEIVKENNNE